MVESRVQQNIKGTNHMAALLTAQTTDTSSATISYSTATTIMVTGVFHGATVILEVSDDGGTTWAGVHTFEAPGLETLTLNGTFSFRVRQEDSGASTSITATYNGSA